MLNYPSLAFTDTVKSLQEKYGSRKAYAQMEKRLQVKGLTPSEVAFIQARDSFYIASFGENDFPYIQHRGGPKGFLKILDERTLAFLEFSGNKQYITLGNLAANNNVSLFLMDYPNRTRLKLYASAEALDLGNRPDIEEKLTLGNYGYKPERIMMLHVKAFDWNCPQHITPRYTAEEVEEVLVPYQEYIRTLEKEIEKLKSKQNG